MRENLPLGCISLRHEDACLRARRAKHTGMADDPVWPDPFRPRIVAPAKGGQKKARGEKRHDVPATHEYRDITPIAHEKCLISPLHSACTPNALSIIF